MDLYRMGVRFGNPTGLQLQLGSTTEDEATALSEIGATTLLEQEGKSSCQMRRRESWTGHMDGTKDTSLTGTGYRNLTF